MKRYVVKVDTYVYAENDYMAKKEAAKVKLAMENVKSTDSVNIEEIGEQPFASMNYRKLDNTQYIPKGEKDIPLPF